MAEVPDYVAELLRRQAAISPQIGTYIFGVGQELYEINVTLLTLLGVVMKAMTDKGAITDAEWLTRLDHALDGTWPDWIVGQVDTSIPR